jgi:hypothetical protein
MTSAEVGYGDGTTAEVRPDAGKAQPFWRSGAANRCFDALPDTQNAICCCSRRPNGRFLARDVPESGECRLGTTAACMRNSQPSIILIGDSHLYAVASGHAAMADRMPPPYDLHEFPDHLYRTMHWTTDGQAVFNQAFVADVVDCVNRHKPLLICAAWGGNQHYVHGAINHPRPFDFVLPGAPELPLVAGAEVIPYDLLRRCFTHDPIALTLLWKQFQAACDLPIYHLAAPPSPQSNALIAESLPVEWRSRAEQLGITPPSLRYKLWWLATETMKEISVGAGIRFLWPPEQTIDTEGLLRSEYANDGIHGNSNYGEAVIDQIDALIRAMTV